MDGILLIVFYNLIIFLLHQTLFFYRNKEAGIFKKILMFFVSVFALNFLGFVLVNRFFYVPFDKYLKLFFAPSFIFHFYMNFSKLKSEDSQISDAPLLKKNDEFLLDELNHVVFKTKEGLLKINNLFTHFLVLAGTRSGKTKSIGLPLLKQYLINDFGGFIYDAKKFDYTRYLIYFLNLLKIDVPVYFMCFDNPKQTYRTNIVKPKLIGNYNFLAEVIGEITKSLKGKNAKEDEWAGAGLGVVQAVAVRFFLDFPSICTISHISLFISLHTTEEIVKFIMHRHESQIYAAELLKSLNSEKTLSGIMWSAAQALKPISSNANVCYVLSGDDFEFSLVSEEEKKFITVSNDSENASVLNGLIGSMVNILCKQIKFGNKKKRFFLFDEGTTFRIPDFSSLLGLLAEYNISFAFLTQSYSKIEEIYDRTPSISILANFNNKFLGRTNVPNDAKNYSSIFGSFIKKRKTKSKGVSSNSKNTSESKGESITSIDELVFKADHFMNQKKGQFTSVFLDSNYNYGNFNFEKIELDDEVIHEVIHDVSNTTNEDVRDCYKELIDTIKKM